MTTDRRLDEFTPDGAREHAPRLERFFEVGVPYDAETKGRAGWVVRHDRPGFGYLSERTRGPDISTIAGCAHFHWKTKGYPISESVVRRLDKGISRLHPTMTGDVTTIYIAETDTSDLYEFAFEQYLTGLRVTDDEPQLSVARAEALRSWADAYDDCVVPRGTLDDTDWEAGA